MAFFKKVGIVLIGILLVVLTDRVLNFNTPIANVHGTAAYAALTIFAMSFGAVLTPIVAFMSHFFSDSLSYTTVWWTWIVADGVLGLMLGLISQRFDLLHHRFTWRRVLHFNLWQGIANILVWCIIAPLGDFLVYKSDWNYVLTQGLTAMAINFVVIAITSVLFVWIYQLFVPIKQNHN